MSEIQVSGIIQFLMKNARRGSFLIMVGFAVLGTVSAFSLHNLRTEYSMRQFLPPHHALMESDDRVKARFQLPEIEPFFALVTLEDRLPGTWLEMDRVTKLRAVTDGFRTMDDVTGAVSIGSVEGATNTKEGITVGRLLELTPQAQWKERILGDPILTPGLLTPDARTAVIPVWIEPGVTTARNGQIQAEVRKQLTETFPGTKVSLGGIPAVQTEMNKILGKELGNFLLLSLLASLCTLLLFFRSVSSVFVPMILMVLANVISLAWMAWTGVAFTVLSSTLPVLVALTVVSMSTHTMLRYAADWELAKRKSDNPNRLRVLLQSYYGLLGPNTLTAITTSVGFFALAYGNIPLIRQYGITVGISIVVCWAVVMGALLPLLTLFPVPVARHWTEKRATWAVWVTVHNKKVLGVIGVFCAVMLFFGKDLNWSARLFDDLPKGHEARATTEFVDAKLGGMIPLDIVIEKNEENAWNDPAALHRLDDFAAKLRQHASVGSVVGPQDFIRAAGKVAGRGLASTRQEAAEYGFLYSMSSSNVYKRFVTVDGRAARLNLRLHDIPADQMKKFVTEVKAETEALFPGWKVTPAAMATTVHELNNELCIDLIYGFWQALLVISLVLACVFRSVRWTIAAALPNLVPVIVLLGAMAIFHTPVKPGIALIFSIALGISFDNTVYLLGRLRLLRDRSANRDINVMKAWYQEANLCMFSSFALVAGFMVFLASFFTLNQQFGFYMVVAILGGMLGDLVLLPAMLAAFPWMVKDRHVAVKAVAPVEEILQIVPESEHEEEQQIAA
jgi:predicted RND superfamily exporter protein